ncbi:thioredoxin-like domain-containing protein [Algoriphagus pacificus]|uniref:Redoxin domain-containing protein n=1 Tax=Algoriphagus pacificus TaxID=2811234 RepID=A0ABS3CGM4_9BACT|nr:redoxin domain-containing protein [Algoriphagus pacificus]MBN7815684.1 redoxin domain-containing protein [Algoriphagus pacificus]
MKKIITLLLFTSLFAGLVSAQDMSNLQLTDAVTGKTLSLTSQVKGKALVLIFHSLNCPFAKMYEERIIDFKSRFQSQDITFLMVNSEISGKEQSAESLKNHIDNTGLNMSYVMDENQEWVKFFNITKIPEMVILIPGANGPTVVYRGAFDNNAQAATAVTEKYLEKAINQVLRGETPSPNQVRAVGCNVRAF